MKYIYFVLLLISCSLFSQSLIIETDTNFLRIGEQFDLKLKVYDVEKENIIWPLGDSVLNDFDLINEESSLLFFQSDTYVYKNYLLTSFDTGKFIIDSIYVLNQLNDTLFSNSLIMNFIAMPLDSTDKFFDIKPPKKIPFLTRELLYYLPYFLLFLFLCICIYTYVKFFNQKPVQNNDFLTPSIPIDVYFLNKLSDLKKKKYLESKKYKDFYTELSEIFRGYLELRFNISALESTSYELKNMLNDLNIKEQWFTNFFRNNDIVKFAKGIPPLKESKDFLTSVQLFIKSNGAGDLDNINNKE
ncbi:MAG: hypothetical protein CMP49_06560 [Flavobacteriales bacterium]|nr:hypothetical protein [Flavobacteriales bacterium]|tara:strand:- start:6057 stop:6959 length:903 start_codon:yes stop_codon:yes gene_type:complete